MSKVTIYHNPNCGTSRNTLEIIRQAGIEPTIIEYLETPPSQEELKSLLKEMKLSAREVLRTNVSEFDKHNLVDETKSEQEIIDAMMIDPILINRPIVVTEKGVKLCRPSEEVLEILPVTLEKDFIKEDGEIIKAN